MRREEGGGQVCGGGREHRGEHTDRGRQTATREYTGELKGHMRAWTIKTKDTKHNTKTFTNR